MSSHLKSVRLEDGTPQTLPANDRQVANSAGGFTYAVSDLDRIRRFLILGSDSTFYSSGDALTIENARVIVRYLKEHDVPEEHESVIALISEISMTGRAPKQSPALFALALVIAQTPFDGVKSYGYGELNVVCRTASTLFEFFGYLSQFQRFGMGARKAIARWYTGRDVDALAYQMVKYRERAGFSHADLLRLSKRVRSTEDSQTADFRALLSWAVGKPYHQDNLPRVAQGYEIGKQAALAEMDPSEKTRRYLGLISAYGLSWEMLPTEALAIPEVWAELVESGNLPMGALVRNLGRMSANGALRTGQVRKYVVQSLQSSDAVRRSRLHPLNLLVAMKTYASGKGLKGSLSWAPDQTVISALETAIELSFGNVEPSRSRMLYALDVSGSMAWQTVSGAPITPYEAETMLALTTARVEEQCTVVGFSTEVTPLEIGPDSTYSEALRAVAGIRMGATDAGAAIRYALDRNLEIDTFVICTDNEVNSGHGHVHEWLQKYREHSGIDARLVVLATTATSFSVADPNDPGMLDIAGFDLATPRVLSEFAQRSF